MKCTIDEESSAKVMNETVVEGWAADGVNETIDEGGLSMEGPLPKGSMVGMSNDDKDVWDP